MENACVAAQSHVSAQPMGKPNADPPIRNGFSLPRLKVWVAVPAQKQNNRHQCVSSFCPVCLASVCKSPVNDADLTMRPSVQRSARWMC